jgi:serine phosphatase RsbU (regulator of sigma subunit)
MSPEESPLSTSLSRGIKITNTELRVKRRSGEETVVLINSAPVRDFAGKIIAAVATINDVTEISNLRKALEHQVDILQKALIPRRPTISKDYCIADTYIPGAAGLEVGGDFYDVFKTESGKVGVMIGDVSGKGVEAAAIAAATRGTAHAFAYDLLSAGAALTHTNSVLTAEQPEDFRFFITLFLGMLDLGSGVLNYSNAGHPPPVVWHPDKPVEFLTLGHPPIGVIETEQYTEHSCRLLPGDKIILYTDGISEARHDSSLFELTGIERIIKEYGYLPPEELLAKLLGAATEWANGRLTDDAAIIVLERVNLAA